MGYLEDLIRDSNDPLFEHHEPAPERTEETSVISDAFDDITWDVLQKQAPSLVTMGDRLEGIHVPGRAVEQDVFNLLYQSDPMLKPTAAMKPEWANNQDILTSLAQSEEVTALREQTQLDEYQTAFAMLSMEETLTEAVVTLKQIVEREQEAAQNLQQAMAGGDPNGIAQAQAQVKAVLDQNAQAKEQVKAQVKAKAQAAADEIGEHNDAMAGYGLSGDELWKMEFENRRALSYRLHGGRLKKLASMIGQWKTYGRGERRKRRKHAKAEVYDYELSNDLTRLVPEEFNNLAVPELEDLFWMRWQQHALLTKKERGPLHVGRGPILIVCDESGSMSARVEGTTTREMWSKAVTFALSEQAKMEKRDLTYIGFASPGQEYQMDFPNGQVSLDKITELLEHFFNGGTEFTGPLDRARKLIEKSIKADRERADIVFITDGDCYVPDDYIEDWQKFCKKADVQTFGIKIGDDWDEDGSLEQLATKVIHINKLNASPEGVQELFAKI